MSGRRPFQVVEEAFGFTIVELMIVLVLVSVISLVSIPQFRQSYVNMVLHNAVHEMTYVMRYAQSRAITSGEAVFLVFDDQQSSYWLAVEGASAEMPAEDEDALSEEEGEALEQERLAPLPGRWGRVIRVPEEVRVEATEAKVSFSPDGRISKTRVQFCHEQKCLVVSTQERVGRVQVYKSAP